MRNLFKKKRLTWTEWKEPHVTKAKRLDVKLSNKNLKRLNDCYLNYCAEGWRLNGLFGGVYEEHITLLVPAKNSFLDMIAKDAFTGGSLYVPIPLPLTNTKK